MIGRQTFHQQIAQNKRRSWLLLLVIGAFLVVLGAVIGFMTWMWLSITVVLLGGELNAQIERQAGRKAGPD